VVDVLWREVSLGPRNPADRVLESSGAGPAAVENSGFVEMNMGLDESRCDKPPTDVQGFGRIGLEPGTYFRDAAVIDADVGGPCGITVLDTCILHDQVHDEMLRRRLGSRQVLRASRARGQVRFRSWSAYFVGRFRLIYQIVVVGEQFRDLIVPQFGDHFSWRWATYPIAILVWLT